MSIIFFLLFYAALGFISVFLPFRSTPQLFFARIDADLIPSKRDLFIRIANKKFSSDDAEFFAENYLTTLNNITNYNAAVREYEQSQNHPWRVLLTFAFIYTCCEPMRKIEAFPIYWAIASYVISGIITFIALAFRESKTYQIKLEKPELNTGLYPGLHELARWAQNVNNKYADTMAARISLMKESRDKAAIYTAVSVFVLLILSSAL